MGILATIALAAGGGTLSAETTSAVVTTGPASGLAHHGDTVGSALEGASVSHALYYGTTDADNDSTAP